MSVRILVGDVRETLRGIADGSARCCVTSPPYFGLRDYGVSGQIGLESAPDAYVAELVAVFREVRRVLADDGTLWLNLGDSYASAWPAPKNRRNIIGQPMVGGKRSPMRESRLFDGLKEKDLMGIPWRVAFALQSDGWYLRSDIIWHKPNPMPESVTDRPTKAHEYLFLLSKNDRYFYDAAAIREPVAPSQVGRVRADAVGGTSHAERGQHSAGGVYRSGNTQRKPASARGVPVDTNGSTNGAVAGSVPWEDDGTGRNARSVWTVPTKPFKEAHFATFPPELPERCIKAGSAKGDTILDPFGGAGTTGLVADRLGRNAILCELNPKYASMAERRIHGDSPMFTTVTTEESV